MKQTEMICAICMEPAGREMIVLNRCAGLAGH